MVSSLRRIERKLKQIDDLFREDVVVNWKPFPGPQSMAYYSEADELLYGGMPGGGKSDLLLGLALTAHRRSLLLRREATQLPGIVARLGEIAAGVTGSRVIDLGDRLLELGGCKDEKNKVRYKGRAHDLKGFDEVTEFTRSQFDYIKVWNRTPLTAQRCRVVATANPPEHQEARWIIDYWSPWLNPQHPRPAKSGELRWFVGNDEVDSSTPVEVKGQLIYPRSRSFIAASVRDNPALMATGYDHLLSNLTGQMALLVGSFFDSCEDDPYQVIPTRWVEAAQARWRSRFGGVHPSIPPDDIPQDAIAGDVARGGSDQSTVAARHADSIFVWNTAGKSTPDGESFARFLLPYRVGNAPIFVDVVGVGSAAYDYLRALGYPVTPVNGATRSTMRDRSGQFGFANKRAELYWKLRELLDPAHGPTLALPPSPQLLSDLTAPRWKLTLHGILLESKDEIKKRLGRSPDFGDAVVMACQLSQGYQSAFSSIK